MRKLLTLVSTMLLGFAFNALAQEGVTKAPDQVTPSPVQMVEKLPKKMEGKWTWQETITSHQYNNTIRITQIKEASDGTFRGLLTLEGIGTSCFATNAPVTGKMNGDGIVIEGIMGSCGAGKFELKKVSTDTYRGPYELANGRPGIREAFFTATR